MSKLTNSFSGQSFIIRVDRRNNVSLYQLEAEAFRKPTPIIWTKCAGFRQGAWPWRGSDRRMRSTKPRWWGNDFHLPAESSALRQRAAPRSYDEWRDKLPLPSFLAPRYGLISSTDSTTTTNPLSQLWFIWFLQIPRWNLILILTFPSLICA